MKRTLLVFGLAALFAFPALATEGKNVRLGVDFAMPYVLSVDGTSVNSRGNFNIGVDGRYQLTENWNTGLRFAFDVEARQGSIHQLNLAPGVQYLWMPQEIWNPYVRMDLPILLRGQQDVGISGGLGLAWNMGEMIGVENLLVRYDFNVLYTFGAGSALPVLGLEFFKIGLDYRF